MQKKLAFIGAGNMATSLIGGLISKGYDSKNIWASNPDTKKLSELEQKFAINVTENNITAAEHANVIILCVKPDKIKAVCAELVEIIQKQKPLIISIAASITTPTLEKWLTSSVAIVRCMPNTPSLVNAGASGLYANSAATTEQKNQAESILRAVGIVVWVDDEKLIDTITVLSGSGPAYFFYLMEVLQDTAMKLGLPRDMAQLLTIQTALGSAKMAMETQANITQLRELVTSKGGTTESAFNILKKADLPKYFYEALKQAQQHTSSIEKKFEES